MEPKHDRVHLLLISETGRVKSRKISLRLIRYLVFFFVLLFAATSCFTYLYFRQFQVKRLTINAKAALLKKMDTLHSKISEQDLEISRLKGEIERLTKENHDLKQHLLARKRSKKPAKAPPTQAVEDKNIAAFQHLLSYIETIQASSSIKFQIREPKIVVTDGVTQVTFKLYKDTFKKVYGRYVLLGVFKPEDPSQIGVVSAYPPKCVSSFKLRPAFGHPFKIERRFLTVSAKLLHRKGIPRFSEFHIFIFGTKKELLFHEKFKAP